MANNYERHVDLLKKKLLEISNSDRKLERLRQETISEWEKMCYLRRDFEAGYQQACRLGAQLGAEEELPDLPSEAASNRQIGVDFLLSVAKSVGIKINP